MDQVISDLNGNQQPKSQDYAQTVRIRQCSCNVTDISRELLPMNLKNFQKKAELSLCNMLSINRNRISQAAKQNLFGDLQETNGQDSALFQLTGLDISTEAGVIRHQLQGRDFREKIHVSLKEGTIYSTTLRFRVHEDLVSGLKVVNNIYKMFTHVQFDQVIGTFAPKKTQQMVSLEENQLPQGFFVRGKYKGKLLVIDSEGHVHCQLKYRLTITKGRN